jgi:hypothetical protein
MSFSRTRKPSSILRVCVSFRSCFFFFVFFFRSSVSSSLPQYGMMACACTRIRCARSLIRDKIYLEKRKKRRARVFHPLDTYSLFFFFLSISLYANVSSHFSNSLCLSVCPSVRRYYRPPFIPVFLTARPIQI